MDKIWNDGEIVLAADANRWEKGLDDVQLAQETAESGVLAASNAQERADEALSQAEIGIANANIAQNAAIAAQSTANTAKTDAATAQGTANNAQATANNAQVAASNAQTAANTANATANTSKTYSVRKANIARPAAILGTLATTAFGDATFAGYYYATHTPGLALDNSYYPEVSAYPTEANIKIFHSGKACIPCWYNNVLYIAFQVQPSAALIIDYTLHRKWN